jgi:uncharacterized protein
VNTIVSDTTALIVLAAQDRLDLLGACFEQVLLPLAVYREWRTGDAGLDQRLERLTFFQVVAVDEGDLLEELRAMVDPGEAEALALARQRGLPLLVDEKKGRTLARMMGIPVLGLVGVLLLAVRRGILDPPTAKEILDASIDCGFRLSDALYQAFVGQLGEWSHPKENQHEPRPPHL